MISSSLNINNTNISGSIVNGRPTVIPNMSANEVNTNTLKQNIDKKIKQLQTKLKNSINGVK